MTLIKNEIPILEFDSETEAILMPGHGCDYKFTKKAVMLFMEPDGFIPKRGRIFCGRDGMCVDGGMC